MRRAGDPHGFSLVELFVVLAILSILVRVGIPAYDAVRLDALASRAQGDYNTVRAAAFAQYAATGAFPADGPAGCVPQGMGPYLPRDFTFVRREYELDWDHWTVSDTSSTNVTSGTVIALTVIAPDGRLGRRLDWMLGGNCSHWTVGDAHTFVVQSTLQVPR